MNRALPERNIGREPPTPPPEADSLPYGLLSLVLFAVLAVFGVAVALMDWELKASEHPAPPPPRELGRPEIQGVNQLVFGLDERGRRTRAEQLRRLNSWGWVDRDAGVAHIPIEEAMAIVASTPSPSGGTDGGTP